ncbi:MAG TPA: MATE family efflux transporter [Candidatus Sulfotelmatobacter sp.]|nr:MATE family efflux transporter [Candidatus Sulfotelmatobacter sp.]
MVVTAQTSGRIWLGEAGATLRLGWPLVLTQIAYTLLSAVNVVLAGQLGRTELATVGLVASLYFIVFMFCLGVATAVAPMVAQAAGRKRRMLRDIRRTVRQGFWVAATIGVPGVAILLNAEALLRLSGQESVLSAMAGSYIRISVVGFIPGLWSVVLRNFVTALSRPRVVLALAILSVVYNAGVGLALSQGRFGLPALGVNGIAVASSSATVLMFLALMAYCYIDRGFRRYHLLGRFWRPDWPRYREMLRLGLPIGTTMLMEVGLFSGAGLLMGILGRDQLAAHQIALQYASTAFMVPLGLAQATSVRVGLAAGAGDAVAVARAGWTGIVMGTAFVVLTGLLFWLAPRPLIALFIDADDSANAAVVTFAVSYLAVAALFQVIDALQALSAGALRGLKDTRAPLLFAAVGYWAVGFPVAVLLGFRTTLNGTGVWIGLAAGLLSVALPMVSRFARRGRYHLGPRIVPAAA